jgi:hypothetical protein
MLDAAITGGQIKAVTCRCRFPHARSRSRQMGTELA